MQLYYLQSDGSVLYAVPDRDLFMFSHTIQVAYSTYSIDEVDLDNKPLCLDLYRTQGKRNAQGQTKYYMNAGTLYERDGWTEGSPGV